MSEHDDNDLLQDYIEGLLLSSEEPKAAPHTRPAPLPSPPEVAVTEADPEDEAARREQLQKLLHSARDSVAEHMAEPAQVSAQVIAPAVDAPPAAAAEPEAADTSAQAVLASELAWHDNGRPAWAQSAFEVLLFKVSGLTLAVPLIALGQIQPLTDELTPLFGQAEWFMGLQPTHSGKIRVLNTAQFVMPERYDANFVKTAQYVVSISGLPWGLAVDAVEQPMTLQPEDVKWRSSRSKRPWLAGTVKAHMCALLDIPMMGQLLIDADRNSHSSRV
jgi:purine-binding chemotaxis protein CheW